MHLYPETTRLYVWQVRSLIKAVERCAFIFPAFRSTSASDTVPPSSAGPRGSASVHRCPHIKRVHARGGLIDHQPGDQVGSQSRLVSSDPLKSDPSSDIPAITPLYLKRRADQPTPLVSLDPPLTSAVQLLIPSIYTPRRSIMLQEPATKYKSSSPSLTPSF